MAGTSDACHRCLLPCLQSNLLQRHAMVRQLHLLAGSNLPQYSAAVTGVVLVGSGGCTMPCIASGLGQSAAHAALIVNHSGLFMGSCACVDAAWHVQHAPVPLPSRFTLLQRDALGRQAYAIRNQRRKPPKAHTLVYVETTSQQRRPTKLHELQIAARPYTSHYR